VHAPDRHGATHVTVADRVREDEATGSGPSGQQVLQRNSVQQCRSHRHRQASGRLPEDYFHLDLSKDISDRGGGHHGRSEITGIRKIENKKNKKTKKQKTWNKNKKQKTGKRKRKRNFSPFALCTKHKAQTFFLFSMIPVRISLQSQQTHQRRAVDDPPPTILSHDTHNHHNHPRLTLHFTEC
jgi:hypothetical protein